MKGSEQTGSAGLGTIPGLPLILETKRREVAQRRATADFAGLAEQARTFARRPFAAALVRHGRNIIAELKQRSPSKGLLSERFDPGELALSYYHAGARCISVLTDETYFGGSLLNLRIAREVTPLPLLQKDFIIDEFQVLEAAAHGADAVLLIVAAFPGVEQLEQMHALIRSAHKLGMDTMVEVHNEAELERAKALKVTLIGVNNRDLNTFQTDLETSIRLGPLMKPAIAVSESGIRTSADIARLQAAGYRAFLIGEQLVTAPDAGAALRALLQDPA